jgi:hypothetical protein
MAACHHDMAATTAIIGHVPVPCGHDHHPIAVDVASANPFVPRPVVAVHVTLGGFAPNVVVGSDPRVDARGPTSPPPRRLAPASTLRI